MEGLLPQILILLEDFQDTTSTQHENWESCTSPLLRPTEVTHEPGNNSLMHQVTNIHWEENRNLLLLSAKISSSQ